MSRDEDDAVAIRTPDQRLRVFVSSTLAELADERAAVSRAIASLRLTPVLFELGARPHAPRELYRAYLAQSDVFVGLYWQRYGWIGPGMDISGLEDEFLLSGSMPRLLYVKTPAPDREPRLTAMIERLQAGGTESYRPFRTARELARLVRDDLALLLSERFAGTAGVARRAPRPPSRPDGRPARSLPSTSTSLIGRARDVTDVTALLKAPDVRLVTLTGPGGVGKTRLAIAVATALGDHSSHPVEFVPLASVDQAPLVLPRVAAAVGATIEGTREPLDALVEHFASEPALLVLDNLEQVADVAPDLDALLSRCPGLRILATSRTVLRLRAEHEYQVGTLTVPAFRELPPTEQLAALPAVQLFVDRAQALRRDFVLDDSNAAAVAEICRRVDGLPLAVELAAARIRLLDPVALLDRLGTQLDALGAGPVDLPERQRTLRATVEWSVGLLDDAERRMLASLSVFTDGWTVEAAVAVSGHTDDRTLDLLDALAGHSLVQVDATVAGPRFRMLAAVRELAADRLAGTPEHATVEQRHAEHFRGLVERTDWPAERQVEWAERLRIDEENIRVAVRWFLDHDIAPLPHMFRVLWLFWQMLGRMPEGRAWIAEVLPKAGALDDRARAELLFTSAVTAVEVGDDDSALATLDGLRELGGRVSDTYLRSAAELAMSWILPLVEDYDGALQAASSAFDGFRRLDDPFVAFAALTVGIVELALGRPERAHAPLTEVEALGRRYDNTWLQSTARSQLASVAVDAGRLDDARALVVASVAADDEADLSTLALTFSLVATAKLALAGGAPDRAAIALGAADGLRRRAGLRAWPSTRRGEAALTSRVGELLEPRELDACWAAGRAMTHRQAVAVVRDGPPT